MKIDVIHSYLVHPGKHLPKQPKIKGTALPQTGRLFDMLKGVFDGAEVECEHEIAFVHNEKGEQENEARTDIVKYLRSKSDADGRCIAERLQRVTTNRSGLGLLFLIQGHEKGTKKIVISRFPAETGILADEIGGTLTVEFLEKVFMKSSTTYKAATYSGQSISADFWLGRAIDKQINYNESAISNYWIREFFLSDFRTPGYAGTRRFAIAVREAVNRGVDLDVKEEIAAISRLMKGLSGKAVSAQDILDHFQVSDATRKAIADGFPRESLLQEKFRFVAEEFREHLAFQTVELDNGGLLTAEGEKFESVFKRVEIEGKGGRYRFSTEGKVIDQRFRKAGT